MPDTDTTPVSSQDAASSGAVPTPGTAIPATPDAAPAPVVDVTWYRPRKLGENRIAKVIMTAAFVMTIWSVLVVYQARTLDPLLETHKSVIMELIHQIKDLINQAFSGAMTP